MFSFNFSTLLSNNIPEL
jgi:hypothetical protein